MRRDDNDPPSFCREEGIAPRRTPVIELFVTSIKDANVSNTIGLGPFSVDVHFYPPPAGFSKPHILVEPIFAEGATDAHEVRVSLIRPGDETDVYEIKSWKSGSDYVYRVKLGDAIRTLVYRFEHGIVGTPNTPSIPWLPHVPSSEAPCVEPWMAIRLAMMEAAVRGRACLHEMNVRGPMQHLDRMKDALVKAGGVLQHHVARPTTVRADGTVERPTFDSDDGAWGDDANETYTWSDAAVNLKPPREGFERTLDGTLLARIIGLSVARTKMLQELIVSVFREKIEATAATVASRPLYALLSSEDGVHAEQIGDIGEALERSNYTAAQLAGFDRAVANMASGDPRGRITLISGPPGTGKTRMVYGMVQALPSAAFLMVPPSMLASLSGPDFLGVLTDLRRDLGKSSALVLLIEDGDRAISRRKDGSMDELHTLLAIGDGPFGKALNMHVIITTNATETPGTALAIDRAIGRKNRLAAHIEVGPLSDTHAANIWNRLLPNGPAWAGAQTFAERGNLTLSDLYDRAVTAGWTPPTKRDARGGA